MRRANWRHSSGRIEPNSGRIRTQFARLPCTAMHHHSLSARDKLYGTVRKLASLARCLVSSNSPKLPAQPQHARSSSIERSYSASQRPPFRLFAALLLSLFTFRKKAITASCRPGRPGRLPSPFLSLVLKQAAFESPTSQVAHLVPTLPSSSFLGAPSAPPLGRYLS